MANYIAKRTALLLVTWLIIVTVVFILLRVIPGDAVSLQLSDQEFNQADIDKVRERLGLDESVPVQYGRYLKAIATGDLGNSLMSGRPVGAEVFEQRLGVTLELMFMAVLFGLVGGVGFGVVSAVFRESALDYAIRVIATAAQSVPGFWLATLVIVFPAMWWGYAPAFSQVSFREDPVGNLRQFSLPAALMAVNFGAVLLRLTRSQMLEVLSDDYIRTARAKGLSGRVVLLRHALRNAMLPVVTTVGIQMAVLLGGTVIYESVFNLRGIGTLLFDAIRFRDYPVVQSTVIIVSVLILLVNFIIDLSYAWFDPRIRYA